MLVLIDADVIGLPLVDAGSAFCLAIGWQVTRGRCAAQPTLKVSHGHDRHSNIPQRLLVNNQVSTNNAQHSLLSRFSIEYTVAGRNYYNTINHSVCFQRSILESF